MKEVTEGDWLFNTLVPTGIAEKLEEIAQSFFDGQWGVNDEIKINVSGKNPEENVSVFTPHHWKIEDCWYVIDRSSRKLIIKTLKGWQRTIYTVRL